MKIGVVSDLHLEFGEYDRDLGTGDVLLVAGDMQVAAYIHSNHPSVVEAKILERSLKFYDQAFANYDHVIEVMGNHEHYHGILNYSQKILKDHFADEYKNLHILEKEAVSIKGHTFFGATLWTDYNRHDKYSMQRAQLYMADFHQVQVYDPEDTMEYRNLHPEDCYAEHQATLLELADVVDQAKALNQPLIVTTHHAPSKRSTHPRYVKDFAINGAYSSDLEHLMGEHIPLWVHGHTHDSFDYEVRGTRIICNPRGYVGHHLNPGFNPILQVEL